MSEPKASERGSSLIGKKLHYRGIQSLFLTKPQGILVIRDSKIWDAQWTRKELWLLSANGRFGMRSRLARNCGYARMDLECAVYYHVLSSYIDFQLQFELFAISLKQTNNRSY